MASLYDRLILPRLISASCGGPAVTKMRAKVTPRAQGRVLELGIGAGANLRFYDPAKVSAVFAVEPSEALRKRARVAEGPPGLPITILNGQAEALPFDGGEFDTVVCTFTLCSVASPEIALSEARRVLKRGGRLLFCEHGLSPDAGVARWQLPPHPAGRARHRWKRVQDRKPRRALHARRAQVRRLVRVGFGGSGLGGSKSARCPG
jgi:SAM-dependent methyltransferase